MIHNLSPLCISPYTTKKNMGEELIYLDITVASSDHYPHSLPQERLPPPSAPDHWNWMQWFVKTSHPQERLPHHPRVLLKWWLPRPTARRWPFHHQQTRQPGCTTDSQQVRIGLCWRDGQNCPGLSCVEQTVKSQNFLMTGTRRDGTGFWPMTERLLAWASLSPSSFCHVHVPHPLWT